MQAPVTDRYATMLGGEFYRRLATDASPDPLLVLAEARRAAERERLALPPDSPLRRRAEWATPALTAHALRVPLFNRSEPPGPVRPPQDPVLAEGVVVREVGDFVGRRAGDAPGPPGAGRAAGGAGAARHRRGRQVHPGRGGAAVPGRRRRPGGLPGRAALGG